MVEMILSTSHNYAALFAAKIIRISMHPPKPLRCIFIHLFFPPLLLFSHPPHVRHKQTASFKLTLNVRMIRRSCRDGGHMSPVIRITQDFFFSLQIVSDTLGRSCSRLFTCVDEVNYMLFFFFAFFQWRISLLGRKT